jgi:hypothetical protein
MEKEMTVTADTIACLQCERVFEKVHKGDIFCSTVCTDKYKSTPIGQRFLNAPIVQHAPLKHGDIFTAQGDIVKMANGIMRVRRKYVDPTVEESRKLIESTNKVEVVSKKPVRVKKQPSPSAQPLPKKPSKRKGG